MAIGPSMTIPTMPESDVQWASKNLPVKFLGQYFLNDSELCLYLRKITKFNPIFSNFNQVMPYWERSSIVNFYISLTLTYRALRGSAPPYLASSFTCVADMPHRRRLRSASTEQLDVPSCRRSTIGGRAFPVAGAKVWNGLPSDVTSASSVDVIGRF